jgi:hypothetical protein
LTKALSRDEVERARKYMFGIWSLCVYVCTGTSYPTNLRFIMSWCISPRIHVGSCATYAPVVDIHILLLVLHACILQFWN